MRLAKRPQARVFGVAAVLVTPDHRYLMQLRDDRDGVSMRNYWGLFGGGVNSREPPLDAIYRELREELGFRPRNPPRMFTEIAYDLSALGHGKHRKVVFEVRITQAQIRRMCLTEGQAMRTFKAPDLFSIRNVLPWDLFVVNLHAHRSDYARLL